VTDIGTLRDRIEAGCERALEQGYSIGAQSWGVEWLERGEMAHVPPGACLCPLGCLAVTEGDLGPVPDEGILNTEQDAVFARALGVSIAWIDSFIDGVDDIKTLRPERRIADAYALGTEMRAKYITPAVAK
jgi:hypothetical protein